MNYRLGIRTQTPNECLIIFANMNSESLSGKLIGQKVLWTNGKSKLAGKIVGFHGKNGVVRARFKKGVPGQAIGSKVELLSKA